MKIFKNVGHVNLSKFRQAQRSQMSEKPSKRERQERSNPNAERGEGIGSDKLDRSQKRNYSSYSTFIYKVLKQVHPDTGIYLIILNF